MRVCPLMATQWVPEIGEFAKVRSENAGWIGKRWLALDWIVVH